MLCTSKRTPITCLMVLLTSTTLVAAGKKQENKHKQTYTKTEIRGWNVYVSRDLARDSSLKEKTVARLDEKLAELSTILPSYEKLRGRLAFWLDKETADFETMVFHPSREWLEEMGYDPNMAGGIQIGNAKNFLEVTASEQPALVLHELAHAHRAYFFSEKQNEDLTATYQAAVAKKIYENVQHVSGETMRAYALTDADEYFAELTEAYFLRNDYYPFVRSDIQKHDPNSYAMLRRIWK